MTVKGVFVTGTDTGIGKTLVSACLVKALGAFYWKPLQTGLLEEAGDTPVVAELAGIGTERVLPPVYGLGAPLSPEAAAAQEGVEIDMGRVVLPECAGPVVVEGAGGVLVPVCAGVLMVDVMTRLGLPVVLVARSGLGTINHTLLSLEALRARGIEVLGVVLSGELSAGNREAIERWGGIRVLFEVPRLESVTMGVVADVVAGAGLEGILG